VLLGTALGQLLRALQNSTLGARAVSSRGETALAAEARSPHLVL